MKYVLLYFIAEEDERPPEQFEDARKAIMGWVDEWQGRGALIAGERLRPVAEATTLKVRGGETLIADGPFAETKERIAGYDIIDCADLDEAIEVASKHPVAKFGMVEVRPFWVD